MSSEVVKQELLAKLKQEHCFWSYNENSIKDIPDDMLMPGLPASDLYWYCS